MFKKVCIIGCGLIGSSLARAIKKNGLSSKIVSSNRSDAVNKKVIELKIVDEKVPFKKGVGRIYEALNISCVPIALNSGNVWPKKGIVKYPGKITVSFLEPIKPGLNRDEFIKSLEKKIYDEIENIS